MVSLVSRWALCGHNGVVSSRCSIDNDRFWHRSLNGRLSKCASHLRWEDGPEGILLFLVDEASISISSVSARLESLNHEYGEADLERTRLLARCPCFRTIIVPILPKLGIQVLYEITHDFNRRIWGCSIPWELHGKLRALAVWNSLLGFFESCESTNILRATLRCPSVRKGWEFQFA